LNFTDDGQASPQSEALLVQGRNLLFNGGNPTYSGALAANPIFEAAIAADALDEEANFFYAATRILAFCLNQDNGPSFDSLATLGDLLGAFGMIPNDTVNIYDSFPYNDIPKVNGYYDPPQTIPNGDDIRAFFAGPFVSLLNSVIGNLDKISNQFGTTLFAWETGEDDIEVDYGDILIFKSTLYTLKAFALILSAYNLDVPDTAIHSLIELENADLLQIQRDLLDKYQDLLRLQGDGSVSLTNAKQALLEGIKFYHDAINYITNESDYQGNDLLYFESNEDIDDANQVLTTLTELKNSLNDNRSGVFINSDTYRIDLNYLFGNIGKSQLDTRAVLPQFNQNNEIVQDTFPPIDDSSPILNGLFPDYLNNNDIIKEIFRLNLPIEPTPIGTDPGTSDKIASSSEQFELLLNITAKDVNDNIIDPATIAHEWLFVALFIGGKDLGLHLYTNNGFKDIETVKINDPSYLSVTYDFDHTGDTFSFGKYSLKIDLGMIPGDWLMYGYCYTLTDITGVTIPNVVTLNIQ